MSIEKVKKYFEQFGIEDKVMEFPCSSATVELAAQAVGCIPARIAKTLSFHNGDGCILIVTAGDSKVDNSKFKKQFGFKAAMLAPTEVLSLTGFAVGGVCPFAVENPLAKIYLDASLQRFASVFPACGSSNSAIELTPAQLFLYAKPEAWVDVCKGWQEQASV